MDGFLISTGLVALAEMGDKTQLLSLMLAARFRKPLPILLGILIATLANHAMAGALGAWMARSISGTALPWILAASFLAMSVWVLIPDKMDDAKEGPGRWGILAATVTAFFLAEMGDKTQVATIALAAQYRGFIAVVAGTTLGMLLANGPVVYLGKRLADRLPLKPLRLAASAVFFALGAAVLIKTAC